MFYFIHKNTFWKKKFVLAKKIVLEKKRLYLKKVYTQKNDYTWKNEYSWTNLCKNVQEFQPLDFSTANVELEMKKDYLFHPHYRFYVREMKILAYSQLLESYRSLTLAYMSEQFGVSVEYIDK